jgi:hypothetical protein
MKRRFITTTFLKKGLRDCENYPFSTDNTSLAGAGVFGFLMATHGDRKRTAWSLSLM